MITVHIIHFSYIHKNDPGNTIEKFVVCPKDRSWTARTWFWQNLAEWCNLEQVDKIQILSVWSHNIRVNT
jgi:hypothetical protein